MFLLLTGSFCLDQRRDAKKSSSGESHANVVGDKSRPVGGVDKGLWSEVAGGAASAIGGLLSFPWNKLLFEFVSEINRLNS